MERVSLDDVDPEPHPAGVNSDRRPLSTALGATDVAIVHYTLDPGEQFSGELHAHGDQEELFYVLEGTATFERLPADRKTPHTAESVVVSAGELIRFAPGEFQCGRNKSDKQVVGLAIAAPGVCHDWDQIETFAPCPECGERTIHDLSVGDGMIIDCHECGNELRVG